MWIQFLVFHWTEKGKVPSLGTWRRRKHGFHGEMDNMHIRLMFIQHVCLESKIVHWYHLKTLFLKARCLHVQAERHFQYHSD